jgi:hypothetical protein
MGKPNKSDCGQPFWPQAALIPDNSSGGYLFAFESGLRYCSGNSVFIFV